jgi:hypothetical protein
VFPPAIASHDGASLLHELLRPIEQSLHLVPAPELAQRVACDIPGDLVLERGKARCKVLMSGRLVFLVHRGCFLSVAKACWRSEEP